MFATLNLGNPAPLVAEPEEPAPGVQSDFVTAAIPATTRARPTPRDHFRKFLRELCSSSLCSSWASTFSSRLIGDRPRQPASYWLSLDSRDHYVAGHPSGCRHRTFKACVPATACGFAEPGVGSRLVYLDERRHRRRDWHGNVDAE